MSPSKIPSHDQKKLSIKIFRSNFLICRAQNVPPIPIPTAQEIAQTFQDAVNDRLYLGSTFNNAYLTAREVDLLDLLMKGKNSTAIKNQLGLASKTVEMHVRHIKDKLQCKTLFEIGFKVALIGKNLLPANDGQFRSNGEYTA